MPLEVDSLKPGQRVGEYELLAVLGRGGQGVVFDARRKDGQRVALKLLSRREDRELVLRFQQEARVLQQLAHPNLLRVLGQGLLEGCPFIEMERVDGQSLSEEVRGGLPAFEWSAGSPPRWPWRSTTATRAGSSTAT